MKRSRHKESDIIASMFLPAAVVMIFTQLVGVVANIIDGVITSRFIGETAYSAVSLLGPMVNIILLFASFIAIGSQIVCSEKIGAGEREKANTIFSFSMAAGAVIALVFVAVAFFTPQALTLMCGISEERQELYSYSLEYIKGYLVGIPAVVIVQVLSPFLVMDNGKKLVSISAVILCVVDIVGDIANALVLNGGVFGMGLATSIAVWLQLIVLLLHFIGKNHYFAFSFKFLSAEEIKAVAKNGTLAFLRKLATILRDIFTNRINLVVAVSVAAVAAKGIQNDLNTLMFCLGIGIGKTLVSLTGIYYGANDRSGLKRVFSYAMKVCVVMAGILGLILFVAAPLITGIYTGDPEVAEISVFGIRCMAAGLILDTASVSYQDFLQGIQNRKMLNFLCFAERFFIPVIVAWILGMAFGAKGIMASIAVSKLVLVVMIFIILCVRAKGIPKKLEQYMLIPEDFGGRKEDNMDAVLSTMDDVMRSSEETREFCLGHGMTKRDANLLSLFVEEMGGNIISHGKTRGRNGVCADFRIQISDDKAVVALRDFCEEFDPQKYYELHKTDDKAANIGIRMILAMAEDIRYIYAFNSNCLMLYMPVKHGEGE